MAEQKQHVDFHRKLGLRRELLQHARPGRVYVPFIGDGDIAAEVYQDREVWGCDIDAERVATAEGRVTGKVVVADADQYPFEPAEFAVADFDAYAYPYAAFRSWWDACRPTECVVFFTDAQRQSAKRTASYIHPDGQKATGMTLAESREVYNKYYGTVLLPWLQRYIGEDLYVTRHAKYLRSDMIYWGAVISATPADNPVSQTNKGGRGHVVFDEEARDRYIVALQRGASRKAAATAAGVSTALIDKVMKREPAFTTRMENAEDSADSLVMEALLEAAKSGNVGAIDTWFKRRERLQQTQPQATSEGTRAIVKAIHVRHPTYRAVVEGRRREVARLRLKGLSLTEITQELAKQGLVNPNTGEAFSEHAVSIDVSSIRQRWAKDCLDDWTAHQGQVLAEIREVKREAWAQKKMGLVLTPDDFEGPDEEDADKKAD